MKKSTISNHILYQAHVVSINSKAYRLKNNIKQDAE